MYKPRLTDEGIKTSKYYNRPYSTGDMPNCTTYSLFRCCENLDRQCAQNLGGSRISNPCFPYDGYRDACNWYKDWQWEKGQTPKLGAVCCWSGTYKSNGKSCAGHVAIVEQIYEDGSFLTSNSNYGGTFFYTMKIPADKTLSSSKYNFKFEGFCYIPLETIERDETKHQVKVKVDGLRIRADHNTDSTAMGICSNGELFNVYDILNSDYRWLNIGSGWIATKTEWVDEYFPKEETTPYDDELEKQIDSLNAEIQEDKRTISTLKDMNKALDEANKKLQDKIDKIGGILNE